MVLMLFRARKETFLPDYYVHGILQAIILEWVAMPSSRGSSQPRDQPCISSVSCTGSQVVSHQSHQKVKVKVAQSCLTLCDPRDYTVHGILLARILDWVAFPFARGSFQPSDRTRVSCIAGGFITN